MARFLVRAISLGVGLTALLLIWVVWQQQSHGQKAGHQENSNLLIAMKRGPHLNAVTGSQVATPLSVNTTSHCQQMKPWFVDRTWYDTHLVFYGKPIMQAIRGISIRKHWKMKLILNDSLSGLRELENFLSPHVFSIIYTSSRALRHPLLQRIANSTNALVSAIRYAYKITGAKKGQLEAFRAHLQSFGCSLEDTNIMPRSFLLDNEMECVQFFKYASYHHSSWWVLKTSQGYGGDGITIYPNLTLLYSKFGTCQNKGEYIVQEYLSNLILLEGRKFDVRALVLIAGTDPYMLFHHDGYLRVSVKKFSGSSDRAVHLTNSHVQVSSEGFSPEKHFWSFQKFQEYLDVYYPENEGFVANQLIPFIKKISLFILQTGRYE